MTDKKVLLNVCLRLRSLQRKIESTKAFLVAHYDSLDYDDIYGMSALDMLITNLSVQEQFDLDANAATCIDTLLCAYETELQSKGE